MHLIQGDIFLGAVFLEAPGSFGGQAQKSLDGLAGLSPGLELQHLAHEHQGDNEGRGLEIDRHFPGLTPEGGGEDAGKELGYDAIDVGYGHAQADEGEHVQAAVDDGFNPPDQKGPAAPEDHRRSQAQLHPTPDVMGRQTFQEGLKSRKHDAHGNVDQGDGEHQGHPEAAPHVHQLGIFLFFGVDGAGFQGHAALGAGARAVLHHFRVHGAGILGAGREGFRFGPFQGHAAFGTGTGLFLADFRVHGTGVDLSPRGRRLLLRGGRFFQRLFRRPKKHTALGTPGHGLFDFGVHGTGQIGTWDLLALCGQRSFSFFGFFRLFAALKVPLRLIPKQFQAPGTAEGVILALIRGLKGTVRLYRHAADRVPRRSLIGGIHACHLDMKGISFNRR